MQRLNEDRMLLTGCTTVQLVGCQPFTVVTWVQPKASPHAISTVPSGNGAQVLLRAPMSLPPVSLDYCSKLNHTSITDAIKFQ